MEERNEKNGIRCKYSVLVIILFAALAFVADYSIIERKTKTCNCPSNNCVNEYDYEQIAGYYDVDFTFNSDIEGLSRAGVHLYLYDDGTFSYRYSYPAPYGKIGNYIIKGKTIVLNYIANTTSSVDVNLINYDEMLDVKKILIINEDGSLTDNDAPMSDYTGVNSIKLEKKMDNFDKNYNEFRHYIKCVGPCIGDS